jgi:hypothetical protein
VDRDDQLTELVVFITPHIVTGTEFVTGDETGSPRGFKSFRDYDPVRGSSRRAPATKGRAVRPAAGRR